MDAKMDPRMARKKQPTCAQATEQGILKAELNSSEQFALLNEFLRQTTTWLDGAQAQQTVFTCQYLAD